MITNAVRNLLNFTWTSQKEVVKGCIKGALEAAWGALKVTEVSHRSAQQKIRDLLDELEKPWIIKTSEEEKSEENDSVCFRFMTSHRP